MPVRAKYAAEARAGDLLPTAAAIALVKGATLSGVVAEFANLPWPPGPDAHALLDLTPLIALAALEASVPDVSLARLARCLGLDPIEGPEALAIRRADGSWNGRAFRAAMAVISHQTGDGGG